jgi:hypothetical protein
MMTHKERRALIEKPFPRVRTLTSSYPNGGVQISRPVAASGARTGLHESDHAWAQLQERVQAADSEEELFCAQERGRRNG